MNKQQRASERIANEIAIFGEQNITKLGDGVFAHNSKDKTAIDADRKARMTKALQLVSLHISNGIGVGKAVESASKAYGLSKSMINRGRNR